MDESLLRIAKNMSSYGLILSAHASKIDDMSAMLAKTNKNLGKMKGVSAIKTIVGGTILGYLLLKVRELESQIPKTEEKKDEKF